MAHDCEVSMMLSLDFNKFQKIGDQPVIPVVIQEAATKDILIVAYTNKDALAYTQKHGIVALWSTSRQSLWIKGETSGDQLKLLEIRVNCEQNSLLYLVEKLGKGACHTKDRSGNYRNTCFYRSVDQDQLKLLEP